MPSFLNSVKNPAMNEFLSSSTYIDWHHPAVTTLAAELAGSAATPDETIRRCFEWVRDEIKHCLDHHTTAVPVKASAVLAAGTGFCYAKSHLLAALLRANGIPAGLCYQRLSLTGDGAPYCLHGLNAVLLPDYGWYRLDPRGNRSDINAQFCPPVEQLAFALHDREECDLPEIWAEPLPVVILALERYSTVELASRHLPDVPLIPSFLQLKNKNNAKITP